MLNNNNTTNDTTPRPFSRCRIWAHAGHSTPGVAFGATTSRKPTRKGFESAISAQWEPKMAYKIYFEKLISILEGEI